MRDALPFIFAGDELIAVADLWIDARWCVAADLPGLCIEWTGGPIMNSRRIPIVPLASFDLPL
jgi:hypothetical protein